MTTTYITPGPAPAPVAGRRPARERSAKQNLTAPPPEENPRVETPLQTQRRRHIERHERHARAEQAAGENGDYDPFEEC